MGETANLVEMTVRTTNEDADVARAIGAAILADPQTTVAYAARTVSVLALAEYMDADYSNAVTVAERAVALARASGDTEAMLYALSARLLASAGTPWAGTDPEVDHFAQAWELRHQLASLEPNSRMLAGHFLAEATLSTGRMSEALEVLETLTEVRQLRSAADEARHPYPPFMQLQWARVLFFQGRLNDALPIVRSVIDDSIRTGNELWTALGQGYLALIVAHQGDKNETRRLVTVITAPYPEPSGYLGAAVYAIAGYALFAIGDLDRAAELAELAGGDDDLSHLQVGDRALTFELLVAVALARNDLASAERWGARSLSVSAHPAALPIVQELLGRIDLARGEPATSAERAEVAAARSRLHGRYLDAARADLLRANALAAAGLFEPAVRKFTDVAHNAERDGLVSIRTAAASQLRRLGRRLPPVPGSGWTSLSERERQIAVLAAEGFSNQVIGATLFLSARTVQSYMSRVLSALDISSRAALPRHVAELRLGSPRDDLPPLTPRQWEVANLVAEGLSNHEIASRLDISVKTAEKHIGEILQRWGVTSRTSIANLVVTETMRSAGQTSD